MSFGSDDEKYQTMQRFRPLCDSYILIVISHHAHCTRTVTDCMGARYRQ